MSTSSETPLRPVPSSGRLLGIDYGTKRVGLAVSTPDRTIASPLEIHQRRTLQIDAQYFLSVIEEYRVVGLIVGLPVHVGGAEGEKAREARAYGAWLTKTTGLPVEFWDERYTSAVAEEHLLAVDMSRKQRKKRLDKVAAQIMLQSYLEHKGRTGRPPLE